MEGFIEIPTFEDFMINKEGIVYNKKKNVYPNIRLYGKRRRVHLNGVIKDINRLIDITFQKPCDEELMTIDGYDNYYITKSGRIFHKIYSFEMKYATNRLGYKVVSLTTQLNETKTKTLHRLIAQHFIPNPDNKPEVDHIDGNTLNNSIENLRWVTKSENLKNKKTYKNSKIKGVNVSKWNYIARIQCEKKIYHQCFPLTEEGLIEAIEWRKNKEIELFGEFQRA